MTQREKIQKAILRRIGAGISDKRKIYKDISTEMGIPQPSVRQAAHYLRDDAKREMRSLEIRILRARISALEARRAEAIKLLESLT